MGQAHPVWKEEVTFKSVQITSDLQVSTPHTLLAPCYAFMLLQLVSAPAEHAPHRCAVAQPCLQLLQCADQGMHGNKPDCTRQKADFIAA